MDINYEESDLSVSPPFKFLDTTFLEKLLNLLTPEGYLSFNLLAYDKKTLDRVYTNIRETDASSKYVIEGEEDINRVVLLTRQDAPNEAQRMDGLENVIKTWNLSRTTWFNDMKVRDLVAKLKKIPSK